MAKDGTVAVVESYPACSFGCGSPARFDGKTFMGSWAFMCLDHWIEYGVGKLGTGYGQKLALATKEAVSMTPEGESAYEIGRSARGWGGE